MHDLADVALRLGKLPPQPVRVSKTALQMASPVWKAMFEKHWAESVADEIVFPDDPVPAMLTVLRIAHFRFNELPAKSALRYDEVIDLTAMCDKYDLVRLVRPFLDLKMWTSSFISPTPTGHYYLHWLYIAWTFGYSDSFDKLARHLALNCTVRPDGSFKDEGLGAHYIIVNREERMPPGILESILRIREDTLSAMLDGCYETLDRVVKTPFCQGNKSPNAQFTSPFANGLSPKHVEECQSTVIGSLVANLAKVDLFPVRKAGADLDISVKELQEKLSSIKVLAYKDKQGGQNHRICEQNAINLATMAADVVSKMPSPVLDHHRTHMETQAQK
ncbi:hypothetical protein P154DRAFT_530850 [Amniculicola lignicola CBS 123094]|uniref:BTB domain-containing protein n=1 Tax=Amniculicola lignicola CBS 123094 TaxID=1392246 RepID=A0A6A5WYE8_9PLEO|nr:hypothetical protein P154DRAFT_530850 [Amniculicola lignicola CBS 123094]